MVNRQERTGTHESLDDIFILAYDGPHKEYCQELISKSNERFGNAQTGYTSGYIPRRNTGLVEYFSILQRAALTTTIANDPQLRSCNIWPITPQQSIHAIRAGTLPQADILSESLAFLVYKKAGPRSKYISTYNPKEHRQLTLDIKRNQEELNLTDEDIKEQPLVIVNAGLERDDRTNSYVKPVILPGITQAFPYKALSPNSPLLDSNVHRGLHVLRQRTGKQLAAHNYLDYSALVKFQNDFNDSHEDICYLAKARDEQ